jgi:hypothetical protein
MVRVGRGTRAIGAFAVVLAFLNAVGADAAVPPDDSGPQGGALWDRAEPTQEMPILPPGVQQAERLADVASDIGWSSRDVAQFESELAGRFSSDLVAEYGPMSEEAQRRLGTSDYVTPDDIVTFLLPPTEPGQTRIASVSAGGSVDIDGNAHFPPVADEQAQLGPPEFTGPWGDEQPFWYSETITDPSTWGQWPHCTGDTVAEGRAYIYRRRLEDTAPGQDYLGMHKSTVVEIIEGSGGADCKSFVDALETTFWIGENQYPHEMGDWCCGEQPLYVAQAPSSLQGTDCTTTPVQVSYGVGGVTGTISSSFERCDSWDVQGFNAGSTLNPYGVSYDNNGSCSDQDRVAEFAMVIRYNLPPPEVGFFVPGFTTALHFDPDQAPAFVSSCDG